MKITRLEIEGFGCHVKYYLDLPEKGIFEMLEDNGYGKSTIAHFIKAMLFGFDDANERKNYKPRESNVYGGKLYYSTSEGSYILSRVFGEKAKDDRLELKDAQTKLAISVDAQNVGTGIFGIDAESFFRSAYLGQGELVSTVTPGIQSKANIDADPADIIKFDSVCNTILDNMRAVNGTGKNSVLKTIRQEITDIDIELKKRDGYEKNEIQLENDIRLNKEKRNQLQEEKKQIMNKRNIAFLQSKNEYFGKNYEEKKAEMLKREAEYDEVMNFFNNGIPEDDEIQDIIKLVEEIEDDTARLSQLESTLPDDMELMEKPGFLGYVEPATIVGAFTILIGIGLMLQADFSSAMVLIVAGAVGIAYGIVKGNNARRVAIEFNTHIEKSLKAKKQRQKAYLEKINGKRQQMADWFNKYRLEPKSDAKTFIKLLERKKLELDRCGAEYDRAYSSFKEYEEKYRANEMNSESVPQESIEELDRQLDVSQQELDRLLEEYHRLNNRHDELIEEITMLDNLEIKRISLNEKQSNAQDYISLADKTLSFLKTSKESFTNKYTEPIMEGFRRYAHEILGDKTDAFEMDANLKLMIKDGVFTYPVSTLSAGQQDAAYLCLRAALLDIMYPGEKPFIIMDDPFVNLDDKGFIQAKKWIRFISKNYQVIYFCCNSSRKVV